MSESRPNRGSRDRVTPKTSPSRDNARDELACDTLWFWFLNYNYFGIKEAPVLPHPLYSCHVRCSHLRLALGDRRTPMLWTWMSFVEAEFPFGTLAVLGCPVGRLHYDPRVKCICDFRRGGTYRGSP